MGMIRFALMALIIVGLAPGRVMAQDFLFPREQYGDVILALPQSGPNLEAVLRTTPTFEPLRDYSTSDRLRLLSKPVGRLDVLLRDGTMTCTATLIADDLALTNHHCVPGLPRYGAPEKASVLMGYYTKDETGTERFDVDLKPIEADPVLDYAVLRVLGNPGRRWGQMRPVPRDPEPGEALFVIHHPGGEPKHVTRGRCRAVSNRPIRRNDIIHTCDTLPGSSGAPLLSDRDGAMIGLHYAGLQVLSMERTNRAKRLTAVGQQSSRVAVLSAVPWVEPDEPVSSLETHSEEEKQRMEGERFEPEMVKIPGGSFLMGAPEDELGRGRYSPDVPQHEVRVPAFAIGKYEVTWTEWEACVADEGCAALGTGPMEGDRGWGRGRRPVIGVSWNDAQAYVRWLSRKTNRQYRLPTEAEWEYGARAGTKTRVYWGREERCIFANVYDRTAYDHDQILMRAKASCYDGHHRTAPVGSFQPNAFGLHDMIGNVQEWVQDCWNDGYGGLFRRAPKDGSAWTSGDCEKAVVRGASWFDVFNNLRSAYRYYGRRGMRNSSTGFRVALTIPQ